MSVFFNGQLLVTPQTASAVNDDAMLNQNLSVGNNVAFVGESTSGKPGTVLTFGNPDEARRVLGSGKLCEAVVKAFSPSAQTGAPGTVYAVRVNQSFAATLVLPIEPQGAHPGVTHTGNFGTLTGTTYGPDDLTIKCKIEKGSTDLLRSITVEGVKDGFTWSKSATDVNASRVYLEILQDKQEVLFGNNPKEVIRVNKDVGESFEQNLRIPDGAYPTLGKIADFLESLTNHAGEQIFKMTFAVEDDRNLPASVLDRIGLTEKKTYDVPWTAYAFQAWFEENVPEVIFTPAEENSVYLWSGPAVADFKYLSAAQAPATTVANWDKAFSLLETQDVQWVTPLTPFAEYHAIATAHVTVCSNVLKRERRCILGMDTKVEDDAAIAYAKKLNSDRVSLVHLGHYNYDTTGKLVLQPAYMTAALVSAAFAGLNPGTPLTNKTLSVMGWERDIRNPTDTDKLLKGGVMPVENTETGYKVTQSISTWLVDSKYNKREQSCGVAIDFTVRNIRNALDVLRGSKQTPILLSRAVSLAKGQLTELARPEPQGPAVLVGDENSPAWRNVTATIEGDVLRVQFEASPAIPNNYILVTMYAVPYSGSATA